VEWIDISVPLRSPMQHWPGDPALDAPLHYIHGGASIDEMPPDAAAGECRVVDVPGEIIDAETLAPWRIEPGERILFRTSNSEGCWCGACFRKRYVAVSPEGAQHLVSCGVRTVGIDYLSIGPYGEQGDETHRILLGAGIWIIEGLNLAAVAPGRYELLCLPLKIEGGDGAPARAMLRAAADSGERRIR
jgi:arylformamidase